MQRVAVGAMVYNEAQNLPRLLPLLSALRSPELELDPIVIVSSGSDDASDALIARWAADEPRALPIFEAERRGKAAAVNRFLEALPSEIDLCVLLSADTLPDAGALQRLLAPLGDPSVGMTGARPTPTNPGRGWVDGVVRFQWRLHHRIASARPKLGEVVAFRRSLGPLPEQTAVDEATLEARAAAMGLRLVYVPEARIYNRGPSSLRELLQQRQRIWAGHLWLQRQARYEVSTFRASSLVGPALRELRESPRQLPSAAAAAAVELAARGLGTWDVWRRGGPPPIWPHLPSTKRPEPPPCPPLSSTPRAPAEQEPR